MFLLRSYLAGGIPRRLCLRGDINSASALACCSMPFCPDSPGSCGDSLWPDLILSVWWPSTERWSIIPLHARAREGCR
jgi:hypothetical protein